MAFDGFKLDSERYVSLMEKLIGETEYLQDNPPKFVPQEDRYSVIIAESAVNSCFAGPSSTCRRH